VEIEKQMKKLLSLLAIILVLIIAGCGRNDSNIADIMIDSIEVFDFTDDDGNPIVIVAANNSHFIINGKLYHDRGSSVTIRRSMDGTRAAFLTDYDRHPWASFIEGIDSHIGGTLWLVTSQEYVRVADGVVAYMISDSGDGLIYIVNNDDNLTASLYLFDAITGNSALLTNDANFHNTVPQAAISPNGKTVVYVSGGSDNTELRTYFRINNGSAEALEGINILPLAIADDGKYIYYVENFFGLASFYVKSTSGITMLATGVTMDDYSHIPAMIFNRDNSQVIYNANGESFISLNGQVGQRLTTVSISELVMPLWAQSISCRKPFGTIRYGVETLANNTARHHSTGFSATAAVSRFVFINNAYYAVDIDRSVSSEFWAVATISNNGKQLFYTNTTGGISAIDPTNSNAQGRSIRHSSGGYIWASSDGAIIYFRNGNGELWLAEGNREPIRITDGVGGWLHVALSPDDRTLFFMLEGSGSLYYTRNGSNKARVTDTDEVRILEVRSTPTSVFYRAMNIDNRMFIFRSSGDENFVSLMEEEPLFTVYR